jgi:hypothetical protein
MQVTGAVQGNDGWNETYSDPHSGKQTELIERVLNDVPRTADDIAKIASLIAGREVVKPDPGHRSLDLSP